jgi:hypothetical protein
VDKNQNLDWLATLFLENDERVQSLPMIFTETVWPSDFSDDDNSQKIVMIENPAQ